jgi:alpha-L-fucosidase 2
MVFSRVAQERLQLNEDTLWAGSPYTPDNPEALAAIPEVRKLLQAKRYKEATDLASAKVMAQPLRQMAYGSLGDVFLNFSNAEIPSQYVRSLDLGTAIAATHFRTRSGAFTREAFASNPHQVIVLELRGTKDGTNNVRRSRLGRASQHRPVAGGGTDRWPPLGTLALWRRVAL